MHPIQCLKQDKDINTCHCFQHCCRDPKQCSKVRTHKHTHTHTRASKRYVKCQFGEEEVNFLFLFACSNKFISLRKFKMLRNLQKKKLLELFVKLVE